MWEWKEEVRGRRGCGVWLWVVWCCVVLCGCGVVWLWCCVDVWMCWLRVGCVLVACWLRVGRVLVVVLVVVVVVVVRTMCNTRVYPCMCTVQLIKMGQCTGTDPFGWTDQPEKSPTPVPSESRFQVSPVQTSPNPKARKKNARFAHLASPLLRRKGGAIFSISSALDLDESSW